MPKGSKEKGVGGKGELLLLCLETWAVMSEVPDSAQSPEHRVLCGCRQVPQPL